MTIVCGTDFSELAQQASEVAAALARRRGEKLVLVHVIDELGAELAVETGQDAIYDALRERVRASAAELSARHEIQIEPLVQPGVAHRKLIELARIARARLLVVGSLGRAQHWWSLGSVAERLVQASPIPVLVVRQPERLLSWARRELSLRALVAVDTGAASRAALDFALGLREVHACDLWLTQVAWPMGEYYRFGIVAPVPVDYLRPELEELLVRDLKTWAGDTPGAGQTHFSVRPGFGRTEAHLNAAASEQDVDLIVVGTGQRTGVARLWQESVSRGVLHHASVAVVTVPVPENVTLAPQPHDVRRVLVATDFSDVSKRALPMAYGLLPPGGTVYLTYVAHALDVEEKTQLLAALKALVPSGASARGVLTETQVVYDEVPSLGICRAANRMGVDLICMATHGRTGVNKLVMGSQATQVLERARQPVLLVPPQRSG